MACCIAIALVVAFLRRVSGRGQLRASDGNFAPRASRPGPTVATAALAPALTATAQGAHTAARARPRPSGRAAAVRASIRTGLGLGVLLHLVAVSVLVWLGVLDGAERSSVETALRLGLFAIPAAAWLLVGQPDPATGGRLVGGYVAMAAGVAAGGAGLLDMHVLGSFSVATGGAVSDLLFHALGPTIALLGANSVRRSPLVSPTPELS